MSEVGSNSSAEEISPEEIEEIQVDDDNNEKSEESSSVAEPVDDNADDPPLEVMTAPDKSAEASVSTKTMSEPTLDSAQPEAATEQIEIAATPVQEDPTVAPVAPAAVNNVILEDVEDVEEVEEVPRDPLVEPPIARVIAGLEPVPSGVVENADDEEEEDDDIDETLTERLIGLTEMFPDFVRNGTVSLVKGSVGATKYMYGFSRSAAWIFFSTASILIMPVMIETERLSIMDQQKQQKAQMLFGPGVAGSGSGPALGPPPI